MHLEAGEGGVPVELEVLEHVIGALVRRHRPKRAVRQLDLRLGEDLRQVVLLRRLRAATPAVITRRPVKGRLFGKLLAWCADKRRGAVDG